MPSTAGVSVDELMKPSTVVCPGLAPELGATMFVSLSIKITVGPNDPLVAFTVPGPRISGTQLMLMGLAFR
jgi:hypothetical protein